MTDKIEAVKKIAKRMAFQNLQDMDRKQFATEESVWDWVVKENFTMEWLGNADQILALIKEVLPELAREVGYVKLADCIKACPVLNNLMIQFPELKLELYLETNFPKQAGGK